jgi:hypothetical protein
MIIRLLTVGEVANNSDHHDVRMGGFLPVLPGRSTLSDRNTAYF